MAKKKRKTLGKMSQARVKWEIKPVTKVKESIKKYNRKKNKQNLKNFDE